MSDLDEVFFLWIVESPPGTHDSPVYLTFQSMGLFSTSGDKIFLELVLLTHKRVIVIRLLSLCNMRWVMRKRPTYTVPGCHTLESLMFYDKVVMASAYLGIYNYMQTIRGDKLHVKHSFTKRVKCISGNELPMPMLSSKILFW